MLSLPPSTLFSAQPATNIIKIWENMGIESLALCGLAAEEGLEVTEKSLSPPLVFGCFPKRGEGKTRKDVIEKRERRGDREIDFSLTFFSCRSLCSGKHALRAFEIKGNISCFCVGSALCKAPKETDVIPANMARKEMCNKKNPVGLGHALLRILRR